MAWPKRSAEERFWAKVERKGPDECWPWTGGRRAGYGHLVVWECGRKRWVSAHRWVYAWAHGPIAEGLCVLHSCDVPECVNPKHLRTGTKKENSGDMVRRRRFRNRGSVLTEDAVREIRRRHAQGDSQASMAREFGVNPVSINAVVHRRTWSYVSDHLESHS